MNGINAPKVIVCIGSDGNKYRQLAKSGNDDLRQDAVCSFFDFNEKFNKFFWLIRFDTR
jgi:phosphatidylinositol kinase/protein kinase (PI-3  family)